MNKPFNGHKNWNHWNVSLWINNDDGLYHMAQDCIREAKNQGMTRSDAAYTMVGMLRENDMTKTPDGAKYSMTTIRAAMVGM